MNHALNMKLTSDGVAVRLALPIQCATGARLYRVRESLQQAISNTWQLVKPIEIVKVSWKQKTYPNSKLSRAAPLVWYV
jgi:hypothetical protein